MAETVIDTKVCPKCGVEVRPDTLFCYNCGASVSADGVVFPTVRDKLLEEERAEKAGFVKKKQPEKELTSAASLRKKKNQAAVKTVEVVWDEPDSAPNSWFIVVALLLTLFAVGVFVVMLYIR